MDRRKSPDLSLHPTVELLAKVKRNRMAVKFFFGPLPKVFPVSDQTLVRDVQYIGFF